MDQETHYTRPHRRRTVVTTTTAGATPPPPSLGEGDAEKEQEGEYEDHLLMLSKPAGWLVQLVSLQVELISTSLLSLLSSPLLALLTESQAAPSRVAHDSGAALRRLAFGLIGAAYACAVLLGAMALAVLLGVALVRVWVEDPVSLRHPLHFDYTNSHPTAAVSLAGSRGRAIPSGHIVRVSLVLLMPESDYNRRIGIFQVTTEVISSSGDNIIATSNQPCMLRFSSLAVRVMRTFAMGIPLLVGMSSESQKIVIEILRYKESNKRSEVIRVRLRPRAGTSDLPQIYAAEVIVSTQLPWKKDLVYRWKWTFSVVMSLYMYIMILIAVVCCFKPFALARRRRSSYLINQEPIESEKDQRYRFRGGDGEIADDFSVALGRWRDRSKMKAPLLHKHLFQQGLDEGSASSPARGETSEVIEDPGDFAVSESSECFGG